MPFAAINEQRIRFEDSGGEGPPVILSHGFLMDGDMFAPQVEALREGFRVITWDERGFGETQFDGRPFSYWDSARDCLGLLDHLGIGQAVLGGMSQGGFLSLRAALLAPDRVRALVLMDTQAGPEDPQMLPAFRQMQQTWLAAGPVPELTQAIAGLIIGDPVISEAWIGKWEKLPAASMEEPSNCLFEREDISDRLGEIRCPALVIHGTADQSIDVELGEALARGLGGSGDLVRVEGGSHAANLTHPDQVNEALLAFLRKL